MENKVTIKIPRTLYDILQDRIEGTGFSSVTEFIIFVMRTVASTGNLKEDNALSEKEIQIIRERLKALGYL